MEKAEFQLSQNLGGSGGSRSYRRKRASHHSYAPSSVPLTVDVCTVSHAPVFFPRRKQHVTWTEQLSRVSANDSSDLVLLLFPTSSLPSLM